ncbi:MAG: class I SAM-dependent methyltransferase [Tildeniella nuda ZEHNDER 1965/U140]|jgi:ubiquinone/menaquinone biosynthesis C-methylase UbiE|nr:class I SAM-dependent methyltransferase [Tildeniella nuda ZEHNDER 1965/U140]
MKSNRDDPTYEKIGKGYNLTRQADPYLVNCITQLLDPRNSSHYLDIACGTGNYTLALATKAGKWTGIDHSSVMLKKASRKSLDITWCVADAEDLPFDSESFDGVIITLALHHFENSVRVFRESARILKVGSPLVLFTSTAEQMENYWLNHYFPKAMQRSITQMPTLPDTLDSLQQGGFYIDKLEPYFVLPDLQDFFLYSGKHRPEIYLDERIRRGSSTFATLADQDEVSEGCAKLSDDIVSGHFKQVCNQYYDDQIGDYIFIRAIKS